MGVYTCTYHLDGDFLKNHGTRLAKQYEHRLKLGIPYVKYAEED